MNKERIHELFDLSKKLSNLKEYPQLNPKELFFVVLQAYKWNNMSLNDDLNNLISAQKVLIFDDHYFLINATEHFWNRDELELLCDPFDPEVDNLLQVRSRATWWINNKIYKELKNTFKNQDAKISNNIISIERTCSISSEHQKFLYTLISSQIRAFIKNNITEQKERLIANINQLIIAAEMKLENTYLEKYKKALDIFKSTQFKELIIKHKDIFYALKMNESYGFNKVLSTISNRRTALAIHRKMNNYQLTNFGLACIGRTNQFDKELSTAILQEEENLYLNKDINISIALGMYDYLLNYAFNSDFKPILQSEISIDLN